MITSVDCGYLVHRSVACGSSVESIITVKQTSASTRVNRFTIQYRLLIREYTVRSSFDFLTIYTSKTLTLQRGHVSFVSFLLCFEDDNTYTGKAQYHGLEERGNRGWWWWRGMDQRKRTGTLTDGSARRIGAWFRSACWLPDCATSGARLGRPAVGRVCSP